MPKQIKKVLFHQISMFLGLAIIIAFSSIFGAILLHQALAVPTGTGSVITTVNNLATTLTDIKGDSFVKNTHSLKQIKDKLDTMGSGGSGSWTCQVVTQTGTPNASVNYPDTFNLITGGCAVGTGCTGLCDSYAYNSFPIANGWSCSVHNTTKLVTASAQCCQ